MIKLSNRNQMVLDLGHKTSFDEEDFVVSKANKMAFDHIKSFPGWPGPLSLITGPAKSGKSHIGGIWRRLAGAIQPRPDQIEIVAGEGGNRPVLLDDVDRAGFDEHGLFHLLNQSIRQNRPLLMTARVQPALWPFATNDVKSRARLASHFEVFAADDAQLAQMFVKLFDDRQLVVEPKTISYLVARMERSPEEVVMLVAMMDKMALTLGRSISRKIASEALAERAQIKDNDLN
ncbi:Chromosomal replication initiator protein DnaA [hydrothermal vent metagenome]|uniref:Chromosomal replication initiator protein DnaA n=1 Tax=hydrothermal vent metagenome TaxID=652676 RepID=A0A3B0TA36_9ZZZZ